MANKSAINVDEAAIHWEELRSGNGRKFEVGHLGEGAASLEKDAARAESTKADFGIAVNWPVAANDDWIYANDAVKTRAAIFRYALYEYNGTYRYKLYFTNTQHYDYCFYDETGDWYRVNTFRNGDHLVRYDSDKPTIAYISGR